MPKFRFTTAHHYETHGPKKGPTFAEGETIFATPDFADRCVSMDLGEIVGSGEPGEGEGKFKRLKGGKQGRDYTPEKTARAPADEASGEADEPAAAAGA